MGLSSHLTGEGTDSQTDCFAVQGAQLGFKLAPV